QTEFPRRTRMLERGERRRARAAIMSTDENHVGVRFRHTGRDRSNAHFSDKLDRNTRLRIGVLEVEDQLREIFDRVNIVMWRRRNQADAGYRVAHFRDDFIDLMAGKLAA